MEYVFQHIPHKWHSVHIPAPEVMEPKGEYIIYPETDPSNKFIYGVSYGFHVKLFGEFAKPPFQAAAAAADVSPFVPHHSDEEDTNIVG